MQAKFPIALFVFSEEQTKHILLISAGYRTQDIAYIFGLSPRTIETHRIELKLKLDDAKTYGDIAVNALLRGIITLDDIREIKKKSLKELKEEEIERRQIAKTLVLQETV